MDSDTIVATVKLAETTVQEFFVQPVTGWDNYR
jgi:hypothetical protein